MQIEELKSWTREQMKKKIIEQDMEICRLNGICDKYRKDFSTFSEKNDLLEKENNKLKNTIEKLESEICGSSAYVVSAFEMFKGECWIKATSYDDVLLRLKKANKDNDKLVAENSKLKEEKQYLERTINESSLKMANLHQEICTLKRNYEEAKEFIELLKEKLSQYEEVEIKDTGYPERNECECAVKNDIDNKSDIINQLQTTIDILVDRYSALRKSVGMD